MEIFIENQQANIPIPLTWIETFHQLCLAAIPAVQTAATSPDAPWFELDMIEITLVDNATSDRVHREFMNIPGETDVITFHHGEIIISAEVAEKQAIEYNETLPRELFRYMIHGFLHLAGHDDLQETEFAAMHTHQESIISQLWTSETANFFLN